jgi:tetratricopeptide (TPR) repeat protein
MSSADHIQAFIERWRSELDGSVAEFAQLATTAADIDLTHGILATAVLWPIRAQVQEYDGDALDALRHIVDVRAKHIIKAMQGWDDDRLACAHQLASQAEKNTDLSLALAALNGYFDAIQVFAGHLAQVFVRQQGQGDVYDISERIKAAFVNIGGFTNIQSLAVTIEVVAPPRPRQGRLFWTAVVTAASLGIIGALAAGWWYVRNPPLPPMGSGFNVAVAQFGALDGVTSPEAGAEFSDWLFNAIVKELDQLPPALRVETRGSMDIGVIAGADRDTRARNATEVADKHNATVLIYGVVFEGDDGLQVQPEFYVRGEGFVYGCEVLGCGQLGHPIPIDMSLDPGDRFELNQKLHARTQALRHIVVGLANFFVRRFDKAAVDFQRAVDVDGWRPDEGKEVACLLLGAAHLRAYDKITNPAPLVDAEAAFAQAYELNPDYSRSYLGLGAVALEQAAILNEDRTAIGSADAEKLVTARDWYSASLEAPIQPQTAYVPAKAAYGLGQVHLLGFEKRVPGWSGLAAEGYFNDVIDAYEAEPVPDLAWFAGRSHAYLGRIAGHKGAWEAMSAENRTAIEMLSDLPGDSPRDLIARYWAWVALAEVHVGQSDEARHAYQQALEYGRDSVSAQELAKWQGELDCLEGEP